MKQNKHFDYILSLIDRFQKKYIDGEELGTLFNYYCGKYFDWKKLKSPYVDFIQDLDELLSRYEPIEKIRNEYPNYFIDKDILFKELQMLKNELKHILEKE